MFQSPRFHWIKEHALADYSGASLQLHVNFSVQINIEMIYFQGFRHFELRRLPSQFTWNLFKQKKIFLLRIKFLDVHSIIFKNLNFKIVKEKRCYHRYILTGRKHFSWLCWQKRVVRFVAEGSRLYTGPLHLLRPYCRVKLICDRTSFVFSSQEREEVGRCPCLFRHGS